MKPLSLLEKDPAPRKLTRPFHGRRLLLWEGHVPVDKIQGWVDNPRIRLASQRKKVSVGDRDLMQDEVFEIMKIDPSFKLAALRDDILANGLREPIVLSSSGVLLDGNRRFFAIRFVLEGLPKGDSKRQDYEKIHAYVLDDSCTKLDEELVLVEENFHPSLKLEWPEYVKAQFIKDDWGDGLDSKEIAKKYGWQKRKVNETIRILQLIDDFLTFATDDPDPEDEYGGGLGLEENAAEAKAAENYQYFNEAQKSFFNALQTEPEFKALFFRWLNEGKFSSFPEVRIAHQAWKDTEARSIIASSAATAAKDAKAVIDYKKRVLKSKNEAKVRIDEFATFLRGLKADEIETLPKPTVKKLQDSLVLVNDLVKAANKNAS